MQMFNFKKIKTFLIASLSVLTMASGAVAFTTLAKAPMNAKAETLSSTVYQTDGASVRVLKKDTDGTYSETDKQGIRFHVEMGANYLIPDTTTPILDTTQTNANGSYKMAEGYKSYTLVLPTRLMGGSGDLNLNLEKVMKIDTTNYWFMDNDGNWESVAYIYNIPEKWYTDEFTYRGIVVKVEGETETPVMWTDMETRIFSKVAKQAYKDTIDEGYNYWGTEENDNTAAPLIKQFIPTYTIEYKDGSAPEEVLWGDKIVGVDTTKTYYDETNHEPIDVTKPLEMSTSTTITLNGTQVSSFVFTGVEYTTEGFNVFATLPTESFGHDVELEPSAVDMVTEAGNVVKATSVKVHVTGTGLDAVSELMIGFSYEQISNGTKLTMLATSHFYNDGILYELAKDYTFEYFNNTWELPLGQITLADIKDIKNYTETDANGEVEHNVRITFNRDFLVNGGLEFRMASGELGGVVIKCPDAGGAIKKTVYDGYYYWNQGQVSILELPGTNGGNFWGEHENDIMVIEAGTRVYQNNGYYLVSEAITATFNGDEDWIFEPDYRNIDASAFAAAYTRQEGDSVYVDVITKEKWASDRIEVVCHKGEMTYNHTDNVTKHVIKNVFYHGENDNQILRLYIDEFSVTGDWVTIPAGTEFWVGSNVYTLTEDIISYFVDTKQWNEDKQQWDGKGSSWLTNPVIHDITKENFTSIGWYQSNIRFTTNEVWSTKANNKVIMDDTYIDGDGVIATGTNYSGFYYYGATNNLLEMQGVNFGENGGSVTLKKGIFFWIFNNANFGYESGYRLAEDIKIEISGATGSQIYKDTAVASVSKTDITAVYNDGSHDGEIRMTLNGTKISGMYGVAKIEGSATLNGEATTSAFVYGGDGTSGYTGNTIIAFTGADFGRAFQATTKGDIVKIAAGTKVWLSNGSGYVTITDELVYVWNGGEYKAQTEHTLTINSAAVPVKVDGVEVTAPMTVKTGDKITFTVEVPNGYKLASVLNATLVGQNDNVYTYTTDYLFGDVTVSVVCSEPIRINKSSIENLIAYYNAANAADFEGFRLQLKATDEINAVATKYSGVFEGTIEMRVGTTTAPTTFHYYGDGNRMIAIGCDISGMQAGDYMTIKAGSIFIYGEGIFMVESDINIITVVANFDANVNGLSLNGQAFEPGKPMAALAGVEATIVYGWRNGSESTHNLISVKINGEDKGNNGTYNVTFNEVTTIEVVTAETPKYTVTASCSGGVSVSNTPQTVLEGGSVTFNLNVPSNATIKANGTQISGTTYTVSNVTADTTVTFTTWYAVSVTSLSNASVTVDGTNRAQGWSELRESGTSITVQASYTQNNSRSLKVGSNSWSDTSAHTVTISGKTDISASSSGICIVEGTMIMMADGTQKAVEDLQLGEMLSVFNHFTGKVETRPVIAIAHYSEPAQLCRILNLKFSDGTIFRMVGHHGLFDQTLGEYVMISESNVDTYLGHKFYTTECEVNEFVGDSVVLVDAYATEEVVRVFSPVTEEYGNYFADGLLNVGPLHRNTLTCGHINYFDFDENLKWDEAQVQADIEQYGLYTYEDFADYISEDVFDALSFKYYKIAVGKGLMTEEDIYGLIYELKNT